ncbi:MAG: hypothetical protein AAF558_13600, partial [Verrucomicrobiota bacterium]
MKAQGIRNISLPLSYRSIVVDYFHLPSPVDGLMLGTSECQISLLALLSQYSHAWFRKVSTFHL